MFRTTTALVWRRFLDFWRTLLQYWRLCLFKYFWLENLQTATFIKLNKRMKFLIFINFKSLSQIFTIFEKVYESSFLIDIYAYNGIVFEVYRLFFLHLIPVLWLNILFIHFIILSPPFISKNVTRTKIYTPSICLPW